MSPIAPQTVAHCSAPLALPGRGVSLRSAPIVRPGLPAGSLLRDSFFPGSLLPGLLLP